ncbi:flagellar filament capping protein FliD [bacterium]|nr:flagellar filament capping protein FliD [bacterium]
MASPLQGLGAGVYSGMDWQTLIDQLVGIEARRLVTWKNQKTGITGEINAWKDVNLRVANLRDRVNELLGDDIWNRRGATTYDQYVVKATAATDAAVGNYDIRVRQLATASVSRSSGDLNTKESEVSDVEVRAGSLAVKADSGFTTTNFDNDIDGWIEINDQHFDIGSYSSVNQLMSAINTTAAASAVISYDSGADRFEIESTSVGGSLKLEQSSTASAHSFFEEINIQTGVITTNETGVDASLSICIAGFDTYIDSALTGSFSINNVVINYAGTESLNSIISKINSGPTGVSAFYDETLDRVMLTAKTVGKNPIVIKDISGSFALDALNLPSSAPTGSSELGKNALLTINSNDVAYEIEKESNTFTINGTTFNLYKISDGINESADNPYENAKSTRVEVYKDTGAGVNSVKGFVDQYNSVRAFIKEQTKYTVTQTDTAEGEKTETEKAVLAGESLANSIYYRLRSMVGSSYGGGGTLPADWDELAEVGVKTSTSGIGSGDISSSGSLSIDFTKLEEAIKNNPQQVEDIFGKDTDGDGKKDYGFAVLMKEYLDGLCKDGIEKGIIPGRISAEKGRIDRIEEEEENFRGYLAVYAENMRRKFTQMETVMGQAQSQGNVIASLAAKR